jgi:hypothetical protein
MSKLPPSILQLVAPIPPLGGGMTAGNKKPPRPEGRRGSGRPLGASGLEPVERVQGVAEFLPALLR